MVEWVLGSSIAINVTLAIILFRMRAIIGPKYFSSVIKAISLRFKHPVNQNRFFKSQYFERQIVDAETAVQFDPETSNSPVSVEEGSRYNGEGHFKEYFYFEGIPKNVDPMKANTKLYEILKRIGLLNDKYLEYKEQRIKSRWNAQIVTKSLFQKWMVGLAIGIGVTAFFMYNMVEFTSQAANLYEQWIPLIEQQFENVPRLVPDDGGGGSGNPFKDALDTING